MQTTMDHFQIKCTKSQSFQRRLNVTVMYLMNGKIPLKTSGQNWQIQLYSHIKVVDSRDRFQVQYAFIQRNHSETALLWCNTIEELVGVVRCSGTYVALLGVLGIKLNIFLFFSEFFLSIHRYTRVVATEDDVVAVVGVGKCNINVYCTGDNSG